jgi:hypothetical protein
MPFRFTFGLENTGNEGGGVPCGPAARPWLRATAILSYTQRCAGFHDHASLSSVGMNTLGGQRADAKYCMRHGSISQIGIR